MDGLLILTKCDRNDYLIKSELTHTKLKESELKCDIKKYFFGKKQMEYLGFGVTREGISPLNKKLKKLLI